jgi:hypothetical protein
LLAFFPLSVVTLPTRGLVTALGFSTILRYSPRPLGNNAPYLAPIVLRRLGPRPLDYLPYWGCGSCCVFGRVAAGRAAQLTVSSHPARLSDCARVPHCAQAMALQSHAPSLSSSASSSSPSRSDEEPIVFGKRGIPDAVLVLGLPLASRTS